MKIKTALISMLACAGLSLLTALPAPAFDGQGPLHINWGRSFESAKYNQIIDPSPGRTDPVENLNGEAAMRVMQQYRNSFRTGAPTGYATGTAGN